MKKLFIACLFLGFALTCRCQQEKIAGKNWIVQERDYLKNDSIVDYFSEGLYSRFSFDSFVFQICFEPVFGNENHNWSMDGKRLKLGEAEYEIEKLNDTSMIIVLPKLIRIKFINEAHISCLFKSPDSIGTFMGKPLYPASPFVCPHYERSFRALLLGEWKKLKYGDYNFNFIVTDKGELGNVLITPSIPQAVEKIFLHAMALSNGHWVPAAICGKPVCTTVTYEFNYAAKPSP
jgi:hypothetical protein